MKRIKGILLLVLAFAFPINGDAANTYISANNTVVNGDNIKATVTLQGVAAWDIKISGNGSTNGCSAHEVGDSGNGNNTTKYFSVTCKATSLGSITFSYSGDVTSSDGKNTKVSGSKKVSVVKPREKSTNNNLKGLSVENYNLTPEFNKDTLEYTVEIGDNAEVIKINAEKEDGYAQLEGDGEKEVVEGANKFEVKVTSETGSEKIYVLNVNVKDNNPIEETINGKTYTLVKRIKSLVLPDGVNKESFTETKVKVGENEIPAYTSEELGLTLIGLKDENGAIYLYKYEDNKITDRYELLTSKGLTIEFKEPTEELEGYTKTTIKIADKEYTVYQNKYTDYALIYGTNIETKEDNWYLYNIKENSLQTYMKNMIDDMNNDFNKQIEQYKVVILGLSGLSLVLLLIAVVAILKKGKRKQVITKLPEEKKEDLKSLENTKELDKAEIIINKVENKKEIVEEKPDKKDKKKKDKKKQKEVKKSDFLNTEDLKEILDNTKTTEILLDDIKKAPKKEKSEVVEEDEMDTEFLNDYKRRKKKRK